MAAKKKKVQAYRPRPHRPLPAIDKHEMGHFQVEEYRDGGWFLYREARRRWTAETYKDLLEEEGKTARVIKLSSNPDLDGDD